MDNFDIEKELYSLQEEANKQLILDKFKNGVRLTIDEMITVKEDLVEIYHKRHYENGDPAPTCVICGKELTVFCTVCDKCEQEMLETIGSLVSKSNF